MGASSATIFSGQGDRPAATSAGHLPPRRAWGRNWTQAGSVGPGGRGRCSADRLLKALKKRDTAAGWPGAEGMVWRSEVTTRGSTGDRVSWPGPEKWPCGSTRNRRAMSLADAAVWAACSRRLARQTALWSDRARLRASARAASSTPGGVSFPAARIARHMWRTWWSATARLYTVQRKLTRGLRR